MKTTVIVLFVILFAISLVTSNIVAVNTSIEVFAKKKVSASDPTPISSNEDKKDVPITTKHHKSKISDPGVSPSETDTVDNPQQVTTDKTKIPPPDTTTTTTPPDTTITTTPQVNCKTTPDDVV